MSLNCATGADHPLLSLAATPAPWYEDLYSTPDVIAPRTPAFNVSAPDKHWIVATQPSLTQDYIDTKVDPFYK